MDVSSERERPAADGSCKFKYEGEKLTVRNCLNGVERSYYAVAYEHLDTELVNELLENGRASLRSLAEELDVSVTTVSNHLSDLESEGVIQGYTPVVNYDAAGYDVTAVMQLKVEGSALSEITATLRDHAQIVSVYEVTGDYDIIAIGKFEDTDDMNDQIKALITDPDLTRSNTSIVLEAVSENEQFRLGADADD